MASKKPAKPIAGQAKAPQLPGKAVLYYGSANAQPFVCDECSKSFIKGIYYEENGGSFCGRTCIASAIAKKEQEKEQEINS